MLAAACWLAGCMATAEFEVPYPSPTELDTSPSASVLTQLEADAARLSGQAEWIASQYARDIAPVANILATSPFADVENEALRRRIALALHREAEAQGLDAELLASVLLVENPWLDLDKRSPVGAVGLMQVMPFHAGKWGCASGDLEDLEANICHGANVLARDLRRSRGNTHRALLRYNGCVRGTNTPDCRSYPAKVLARTELRPPQGSSRGSRPTKPVSSGVSGR